MQKREILRILKQIKFSQDTDQEFWDWNLITWSIQSKRKKDRTENNLLDKVSKI